MQQIPDSLLAYHKWGEEFYEEQDEDNGVWKTTIFTPGVKEASSEWIESTLTIPQEEWA